MAQTHQTDIRNLILSAKYPKGADKGQVVPVVRNSPQQLGLCQGS